MAKKIIKQSEPKQFELAIKIGTLHKGFPLTFGDVISKTRQKELVPIKITPYSIIIDKRNIAKAQKQGIIREVFNGPWKDYTKDDMLEFANLVLDYFLENDCENDEFISKVFEKYQEINK